jgi:hypothetical protein
MKPPLISQLYPVVSEREHVKTGVKCWCNPTVTVLRDDSLLVEHKTGKPA